MTDATLISRAAFIERYRTKFDELYAFDGEGECVIRERGDWESLEFPAMTLPGWAADAGIFNRFLGFISAVAKPGWFVLAEVESVEKFTEARIVPANRSAIEKLWSRSRLPHFKTVCFDESALWCALFDSLEDRVVVRRASPDLEGESGRNNRGQTTIPR
ncbi:MAG: hypothetical protein EKK46_09995 [Rhodocyclaceae bacterium]|nr:MAG: hypothetical protein EKK46_09995 [Rhodocyclaceae bacterium]